MIQHVALEVPTDPVVIAREVEFWAMLGYTRLQKTRTSAQTEWLRGRDGSYVHLIPLKSTEWIPAKLPLDENLAGWSRATPGPRIPRIGHVCIVPDLDGDGKRDVGLSQTIANLERLNFDVAAEEADDWNVGKRLWLASPSGHRVELLEMEPRIIWTEPPSDETWYRDTPVHGAER